VELGLYCEGGPPLDVADRINASFPSYLLKPVHQRIAVDIANDDRFVVCVSPDSSPLLKYPPREMLDGLRRVGFRLNTGLDGTGFVLLVLNKASGYYFGANFPHVTSLTYRWTPPANAKHRCWREPVDNRWED